MRLRCCRRPGAGLAAIVVAALLAACTSGRADEQAVTQLPDPTGGAVSVGVSEPRSLLTVNAADPDAVAVLKVLSTGLVRYDPRTARPVNEVAESIKTTDGGTTWVVTLEDGWTFHNGERVTAASFVNAWNFAAYLPNAAANAGAFSDIAGYDAVHPQARGGQPPTLTARTLSGLTVVDDLTFTVRLDRPSTAFPARLGHPAFFPLPEAFFADPQQFNEQPVGNGPYRIDGPWQHGERIRVVAYDGYSGSNRPTLDAITFRIYGDTDAAYADLAAGRLDILRGVPAHRVEAAKQRFGDRVGVADTSQVDYIGFPAHDPLLGGEDARDLRAALSMAIDREALAQTVFDGGVRPAGDLLAPVVPGHREVVCERWTHDPEQAKALYDAAGGVKGTLTLWYNADGGHEEWVDAVGEMWRATFGIKDIEFESLPFDEYVRRLDAREVTGAFRLGWQMDFPHPHNYLHTLLGGESAPPDGENRSFYRSDAFDAALNRAQQQTTLDGQIPLYQEAGDVACRDVPVAPVFYRLHHYAWSDAVADVTLDPFGAVAWELVTTR